MFLAATLLVFSFPQVAPATERASDAPSALAEMANTDLTRAKSSSSSATLPLAPKSSLDNPEPASAEAILPGTGIRPASPPKTAIRGFRYEIPKQKVAWIGLSVAGHGTAGFDAYWTRKAITGGYGTESNPLLRPFAHSGALYVATQVSPTVMDYLGHKMMTNRRPWVRKIWWVPQTAGASFSIAAGVHNLNLVK